MHIFTYGSLMYAPVWTKVVTGHYPYQTATLYDYQRVCVKNEDYPVIIPQAGKQLHGIIYFDVSTADVKRLDAFEGEYYNRINHPIQCQTGNILEAAMYALAPEHSTIAELKPWPVEQFEQTGLQRFLQQYRGFHSP